MYVEVSVWLSHSMPVAIKFSVFVNPYFTSDKTTNHPFPARCSEYGTLPNILDYDSIFFCDKNILSISILYFYYLIHFYILFIILYMINYFFHLTVNHYRIFFI